MMNNRIFGFSLVIAFGAFLMDAGAVTEMPAVFSDGMVLQRDRPISVWGEAGPGETITIGFKGRSVQTTADEAGQWMAHLPPLPASATPSILEVKSSGDPEAHKVRDVLVGEVWIAGGQSNMTWVLRNSRNGRDVMETVNNPLLRFYTVPRYEGWEVEKPADFGWRKAGADPQTGAFSAVAYFFAAELQRELGIPVGILNCNRGASSAETWMSEEQLRNYPSLAYLADDYDRLLAEYDLAAVQAYQQVFKAWSQADRATRGPFPKSPPNPYHRQVGTALYRTMLSKIIPFTVRGAIWYQGEANANQRRGYEYRTLFPALIHSWREAFNNPEMPFYFVQLATYGMGDPFGNTLWAELREAQLLTWQRVENTGMVVAADYGEEKDIHPKAKRPVGKRLARFALNKTYGLETDIVSGPIYKDSSISDQKIILEFDYLDGGLVAKGELSDFEIAGEDQQFLPAKAEISGDRVIVSSPEVEHPVAARYGWKNWFVPTLFNEAGLPASPFRTDDFPLHTQEN